MAKVALTPQHLLMTGRLMELGDVAEVTYSHPMMIGDAFVGGGANLLLVIEKFPSANTLEVTRGVEQALGELGRGLPGVEIDANVFRLSTYIEASMSNLASAIVFGGILVVLVIGAFLFNWRSALISVVSIPVSLLTAVVILGLMDATLNSMILAGLIVGLGVVIDDAIVDVEKIMGRLREREEGGPSVSRIILETTLETRSATIYAALIVLMAVTPIFFMGGIAGAFFEPLAVCLHSGGLGVPGCRNVVDAGLERHVVQRNDAEPSWRVTLRGGPSKGLRIHSSKRDEGAGGRHGRRRGPAGGRRLGLAPARAVPAAVPEGKECGGELDHPAGNLP